LEADSLHRTHASPIGVRDLLVGLFLTAICFSICKSQIEGPPDWLIWFAVAIPAIITALMHWRFRLTRFSALAVLYLLVITWGFVGGVTYSLNWVRTPHEWFERESVGADRPIQFGLVAAEIWIVVGVAYVSIYAVFHRLISVLLQNHSRHRGDGG
jgi:hypothetical protein